MYRDQKWYTNGQHCRHSIWYLGKQIFRQNFWKFTQNLINKLKKSGTFGRWFACRFQRMQYDWSVLFHFFNANTLDFIWASESKLCIYVPLLYASIELKKKKKKKNAQRKWYCFLSNKSALLLWYRPFDLIFCGSAIITPTNIGWHDKHLCNFIGFNNIGLFCLSLLFCCCSSNGLLLSTVFFIIRTHTRTRPFRIISVFMIFFFCDTRRASCLHACEKQSNRTSTWLV